MFKIQGTFAPQGKTLCSFLSPKGSIPSFEKKKNNKKSHRKHRMNFTKRMKLIMSQDALTG